MNLLEILLGSERKTSPFTGEVGECNEPGGGDVTPAQAGVQMSENWMPACVGMTTLHPHPLGLRPHDLPRQGGGFKRAVFFLFCVLFIASVTTAQAEQKATATAPLPSLPATPAFTEKARIDMTGLFANAWRHGLNPDRYQAAVLQTEMQKPESTRRTDPKDARRSDLNDLFLQSAVRYARDLSGMRVRAVEIGLRSRDWRQPMKTVDILTALAAAPDPVAYLQGIPPQTPLYRALQDELEHLSEKIKAGEGGRAIHKLKGIKRSIRPGDTQPVIADLRQVLGSQMPAGTDPNKYDDALAQVVMAFQRNHGLKDDGIIGQKTVRFFNQTNQERYEQVMANLERLRWLDPVKPPKYIVVNIPAATLWAVENDQVVTEMPVIVGRAKRPTHQFKTDVHGVRFNPTWTVPEVIKKEDFLPELQKDPSFLATKGIKVWKKDEGSGEQVQIDPLYVDWQDVTEETLGQYRMVQPSGRGNVLGLVRVLMPNQYDIYLHDTNTPEYFRAGSRDVSSGCVRLSRPIEIARFVLSGEKGWDDTRMQAILAKGEMRDIMLGQSFPAIFTYQTAWMKKGGQLVLAYDIYEEDIKLYRALDKMGHLPKLISRSTP